MAEKLTNITAPQHRCSLGACPAVYKSEDGKTFTIIGAIVGASQIGETKVGFSEEAVEISADLLLSSLRLPALIEAAESIVYGLEEFEAEALNANIGGGWPRDRDEDFVITYSEARALREALSSIKGGK